MGVRPRTGAVSRAATTRTSPSDPDSRLYPARQCRACACQFTWAAMLTDTAMVWWSDVQANTSDGTAERDIAAQMLADVALQALASA